MDSARKVFTHSSSGGKPTLNRLNALGKNNVRYVGESSREGEGDPFRIDGDDDRVTDLLNRIGITRPDMLGIPEDAWRSKMNSRPASCELHYDRHPEADLSTSSVVTSRTRSLDLSRRIPEPRRLSLQEDREENGVQNSTTKLPSRLQTTSPFNNLDDIEEKGRSTDSQTSSGILDAGRSLDSQTSEDFLQDSMGSRSSDSSHSTISMSEVEERTPSTPTLSTRLSWTSWKKLDLLGSGSFGTVYRAVGSNGNFFAVKEVSLVNSNEEDSLQLQQEIALLRHCEHDNIVQYLGTERGDKKLNIFLELVTQGSLASQYKMYPLFDEQIRIYTRQILRGLAYLHEKKVVHRDIKCANILVHAYSTVKLADFGMAKQLDKINSMKSCKGSAYWMAPEVVNPRKTAGFPADIWSLGCTVLEMATGKPPFSDLEWHTVFWKVGHGEVPPIPETLPADARNFIAVCLQVEPSNRPTARQLLDHPFVTPTSTPVSVSISQVSVVAISDSSSCTPSPRTERATVRSVRTRPSLLERS